MPKFNPNYPWLIIGAILSLTIDQFMPGFGDAVGGTVVDIFSQITSSFG